MGSGFSTPKKSISRTELLKATTNNREFINKLFQVMISTLTPEDILKLGNYQQCSKYVFLMAESLDTLFHDIRIRPKQDKSSGIVYFQQAEKLIDKSAETKGLCLIIAYFYIRIFQIFGALSLSVIDDPNAGSILGAVAYAPPQISRRQGRLPGSRGAVLGGGLDEEDLEGDGLDEEVLEGDGLDEEVLEGGALEGGATKGDFRSGQSQQFKLIAGLLGDKLNVSGKPAFQFNDDVSNNYILFPEITNLNLVKVLNDDARSPIKLSATFNINENVLKGRRRATIVSLKQFTYTNNQDRKSSEINKSLNRLAIEFEIQKNTGDNQLYNSKGSTLFQVIEKYFEQTETILEGKIAELDRAPAPARGFGQQGQQVRGFGQQGQQVRGFGQQAPGGPDTTLREFQTKYIIDTLKALTGQGSGPRTTSFCIARAIQLIDAQSQFQPKSVITTSGICMPKFDRVGPSVPMSRTRIDSVPGIKALDQLYHDSPHVKTGTQSTFEINVSDMGAYTSFLTEMSTIFGSTTKGALKGMESILAKDPTCTDAKLVGHYLKLTNPKHIANVMVIVKQMFGRQLAHTNRVIKFLKEELVIIRRQKTPSGTSNVVSIHPKLLVGGINAINITAKKARVILVEYYKNCESLYQEGISRILKGKYESV